jgi:hypothetical protein
MQNQTEKLSLTEDRSSALAVASGSPSDSLEARNERLMRICKGWADAADAAQQPETFYEGYSEAVMRAMQAMLTEAKADRDALRKELHVAEQAILLGNEDLEEVREMLGKAQAEIAAQDRNITLCACYALGIRVEEGHEYFDGLRQTTNDVLALAREHKQAMNILREIVAQYDAMPDGSLGAGLTNSPFLAAKDFLANK